MVCKGLEKRLEELEIKERIETIQTTEGLISDTVLRRTLDV